ncbi:MAG: hypothetical protein RL427_1342 [Bacteroidota bacterium]|jgi:hypothetical protein
MKKIILLLAVGAALTTQTLFAQVPSYVPTNGLVGYWPFNGNANDESGNGNNGTVNGATLTSDRNANANCAYSFDGISNYITINHSSSLNLANNLTISLWYNTNDILKSQRLIDKSTVNISDSWLLDTGNNIIRLIVAGTTNTQPTSSANFTLNNTWTNLTVTYDGSNVNFYRNGILFSTFPQTGNTPTNTNPVRIGINSLLNNANTMSGKIDDIGIWNRALSQQEITAMYNGVSYSDTCNNVNGSLTQGLVGYWPFCGNANDESGNGNNGTNNGASLTADRFGNSNSAYSFDGISNFISVSNIAIQGNTSRSTSFWLKTNSATGGMVIATGSGTNQNGATYNLRILDEGFLSFMGGNFTSCCYDINPTTGIDLKDNNWHNCVVTYDSNTFRFYIDGILISTTNLAVSTDGQFNYFGKSNDANTTINSAFFNGIIDDIGIWNRVLTQEEITTLFNANQCITNITVTDTLIINVGQLSFNDPVTWANNITIAPNPASSEININFNNITNLNGGTLKIINSLGQEVATTPITTSGTNSTMQLATWGGTGMYFVQIINPQGQIVDIKKIILQ